jgi:hypothetical protein
MKVKVLLWLAAAAATVGVAAPAACQECQASLQSHPPAWSALQTKKQPDTAQMKLFIEVDCRDCDPMIVVEVFAGAASARFRSMPLGRKTGTDFAEAVISDDQERSDFLDGTLAAERLLSAGCVMDGRIDGVSQIGGMGMIVANMRAECDHVPEKLRAVFFSGYDGLCLYRVRVMWLGWAGLSINAQDQVLALLDQIRFGQ